MRCKMKKDNLSVSNLLDRATSKKPSFWQKIQNIALIAGAVATTVLTGGIALPAVVTTVATYVAVAAASVATVAQFTKEDKQDGSEPAK